MRQKYKGDDIRSRLHGTVIRYDNVPYLCDVDSEGNIGLYDIASGNLIHRVSHDDKLLDISSIQIGYMNVIHPELKIAVYLKREPLRRFKQGIEFDYLKQEPLGKTSVVHTQHLKSAGFVEAVMGKFPSLADAHTLLTKRGWTSVALSRDVAIKREDASVKVYIKGLEVGVMKLGTNRVIVPKSNSSDIHVMWLKDLTNDWEIQEGFAR